MIPIMKTVLLPLTFLMVFAISGCGKKANVSEKKANGNTIQPSTAEVYFNALKEITRAVTSNDIEALKKVVSENPDVDLNQILNDGDTFLIIAIKNDFRLVRNFLIEKNVSLEKPNVNKETPLIAAVSHGRKNSTRVLLDNKVNLESKNDEGDTALHVAIKKNNDSIALLLINRGASTEAMDKQERSASKLVDEYDVPQCKEFFDSLKKVEIGAPDIATYRKVIEDGDAKRLTTILTKYPGLVLDYETINPLSLLVIAKDSNNALKSAELLLSLKANVNGPKDAESTPLIKAVREQKFGFVNLFLDAKANHQIMDRMGKSALIHAVELNNPQIVELLLSYSALEKYTFRRGGRKINFNACVTAKNVGDKLQTEEGRALNKKIRESLNCGLVTWPIQLENRN
jgi:ankyrin repeat protein